MNDLTLSRSNTYQYPLGEIRDRFSLVSRFEILIVIAVSVCLGSPGSAQESPRRSPNILLVLTDDQGWGDVQAHGNPELSTPWMDQLRKDGASFNRFFVSPVCAPTRASLLTGRYHLRCGVHGVTRGHETMRSSERTIAEVFREAGYRTGCFGKWHNGAHFPHDPQGQGFDEFLGFCGGHWNNYFDVTMQRNQSRQPTQGYMIDVLTEAAIDFIENHSKQPFFCYVSWNTPHSPFQVPDKFFEKFRASGLDEKLACIYGMCENLDENLGKLITSLAAKEIVNETIIVFLSDNGPNSDRYNGNMRGRKGSVHEGGIRVPCFIVWPGKIPANNEVEQISSHIDLLPTLAALAGIQLPESMNLDGVDLSEHLKNSTQELSERLIFTHHFRRGGHVEAYPCSVRSERYRAVNERDRWELYDMEHDPSEEKTVSEQQGEALAKLKSAYESWFREVTSDGFASIPIEIGHAAANLVELPAHEAILSSSTGTGVSYSDPPGWANDWITNWTDSQATASWPISVTQPGEYEIVIQLSSHEKNVGSKLTISCSDKQLIHTIRQPYDAPIVKGPDRGERYEAPERKWKTLNIGSIRLEKSISAIEIQAKITGPAKDFALKGMTIRYQE